MATGGACSSSTGWWSKKLLDYYQARGWRLRLWPVHTGGMDKLLTYPMPCKGITAQVPTHQKG